MKPLLDQNLSFRLARKLSDEATDLSLSDEAFALAIGQIKRTL